MKILFDLRVTQPMNGDKRHGGGKYGEIVLKRIIERNLRIYCCYDSRKWLNPEIRKLICDNNIETFDLSKTSYEDIIERENISLVFESSNLDGRIWGKINCPVLGVIHGLRGLEIPLDSYEFLYRQSSKNLLKAILKRLSKKLRTMKQRAFIDSSLNAPNIRILTVSNHSASSFKVFFPNYTKDIPVFYSPSTSVLDTTETKYSDKYFLLVSANRPAKNNLRAIIALDKLFCMGVAKEYRVKVTGVGDDSFFRYRLKNREKFDFLGYVDEKDLDQLYHDAYCFIYPSLNEGFGYPPLEAMHYGVPVLTTAFTAIPEICGDSVIYFNPFSVEEIMNRILLILKEDVYNKFSELGVERFNYITQKQNEDLDRLVDFIYNFKQ